jgi:hypothetical protein
MNNKHNIKSLLTELMQFFVSIPESKEKHDLDNIIHMLMIGHVNLKDILESIQGNIDRPNKDVTLREKNIKLWEHVKTIFVRYLRS